MRIAYLVNQYPKVSHSFIRREIHALEALGADVLRVASRGWDEPLADPADEQERGRTHYLLREGPGPLLAASLRVAAASPAAFLRATGRAAALARLSPRPLPVHLAYLAQACRLRELALAHGVQHVHAHFGTNAAEVALLCAGLGGPPFSFTVHGPEEFDMPAALHLREKVRRARFVAAVSSFGRSQLYRWIPHAEWAKVAVVRCGVDAAFTQGSDLDADEGPAPASRTVVCVGRLCEQKGQQLLLAAARELAGRGTDFELVLAGDGEMRAQLEQQVDAWGLRGRVRITGWLSGAQVRALLLQSRGLILPSFAEGLPVVMMEAMALRRPVIGTLVAGIPELVRPGREGWLVPAGDCAALVSAWSELMAADGPRLQAMGRSAQERVTLRHSAVVGARKLLHLFQGAA